jgi:hypothetical protein
VKAEHAATGSEVADHHRTAKHRRNAGLIVDCLGLLGIFRLFRQVTTVNRVLRSLTDGFPACPARRAAAAH